MTDKPELKRRIVNACAAVTSFAVVLVLSNLYSLFDAVGFKTPYWTSVAAWALFLFAGIALMSGAYRPRKTADGEFPETGAEAEIPRRRGKPAFLVPAAVFLIIAVDILISLSGLGKAETPSYTVGELAVRAVLGCTVYPVLEETFFRGFLLGALRERDDPLPLRLGSAAATAAAFAAVHPDSGFVFPFAAGLILAVVAPYGPDGGKKFFLPVGAIVAHACYNLALYVSLALMMTGFEPVTSLSVFAGVAAVTAGVMILSGGRSVGKRRENKEYNR